MTFLEKVAALELKLAYDLYDVKKWVRDNPEEADNREDLFNWACEKFDVKKEDEDDVWKEVVKTGLPG